MITIRKVTAADIEFLKQRSVTVFKSLDKSDHVIVVEREGQILGMGAVNIHGPRGLIKLIHVFPEGMDQGFEDSLVRGLINLSDRRGVRTLFVAEDLNLNKDLLSNIGFKQEDSGWLLELEDFYNSMHCR